MANIQGEFNSIANELTRLFKDEIKKLGLVDTGKLINSIEFTATKTTSGYKLSMSAEDYFQYLDKKYNISQSVYRTAGYKNVQTRIAQVYNLIILEELKRN